MDQAFANAMSAQKFILISQSDTGGSGGATRPREARRTWPKGHKIKPED